jgi:hypothetical protein
MTLYTIRGHTVTAYASAPTRASEGELRVRSAQEIEASRLTNAQMAAIWNALPGMAPVAKFKDRNTAVQRLWAAFRQLPVASRYALAAEKWIVEAAAPGSPFRSACVAARWSCQMTAIP